MQLKLKRFYADSSATLGTLFVDNVFNCFTLEDTRRAIKVKHETRIPSGTYEIKFREVMSNMTRKYKDAYSWFSWHLELQGVPNYENVYIHIGNNKNHTSGCILVGFTASMFGANGPEIGKSKIAFEPLYKKLATALESGEKVYISIEDNP